MVPYYSLLLSLIIWDAIELCFKSQLECRVILANYIECCQNKIICILETSLLPDNKVL